MKRQILALLFILPGCITLISQNLPSEYFLSYDGRRLSRGAVAADGLYNDKVIKRIDLEFNQTNWQFILSQNYNSKIDLPSGVSSANELSTQISIKSFSVIPVN